MINLTPTRVDGYSNKSLVSGLPAMASIMADAALERIAESPVTVDDVMLAAGLYRPRTRSFKYLENAVSGRCTENQFWNMVRASFYHSIDKELREQQPNANWVVVAYEITQTSKRRRRKGLNHDVKWDKLGFNPDTISKGNPKPPKHSFLYEDMPQLRLTVVIIDANQAKEVDNWKARSFNSNVLSSLTQACRPLSTAIQHCCWQNLVKQIKNAKL